MTYIPPDPASAYAIPPFAGEPDLGCREAKPEIFFPAARGDDAAADAKFYCRRCDYRWECLEFALATDQRFGVWGGATPEERKRMLAAPKPSECGTNNGYHAHRRVSEEACDRCKQAHSAHELSRYYSAKETR